MRLPRRWLFVAIGLLVANALAMTALVTASSWSPPTIVPHYYERAVAWDQALARARAADALGWQIDFELDAAGAVVRARDGDGRPVADVQVRATGVHRGRPDHLVDVEIKTDETGRARAVPRQGDGPWPALPGWYELELAVTRGAISYAMHRSVQLRTPQEGPSPADKLGSRRGRHP